MSDVVLARLVGVNGGGEEERDDRSASKNESSSSSGGEETVRRGPPRQAGGGRAGPEGGSGGGGQATRSCSKSSSDDDEETVSCDPRPQVYPIADGGSSSSSSDDTTRRQSRGKARQGVPAAPAAAVVTALRPLKADQVRSLARRPEDRLAFVDGVFASAPGKLDGRVNVVVINAEQVTLDQVQALATIHHPNLATILGYVASPQSDTSGLALVVPVYAPTTIATWINSAMLGPYTVERYTKRLTVLTQTAKGVAFLHSRGVVHGALDATTVLVEDRSPPNARVYAGGLTSNSSAEDDVRAVQVLIWNTVNADRAQCTALEFSDNSGYLKYRVGEVLHVVDDGQITTGGERTMRAKHPGATDHAAGFVVFDWVVWNDLPPFPATPDEAMAAGLGVLLGHATTCADDLGQMAAAIECERDHPRGCGWGLVHMHAVNGTLAFGDDDDHDNLTAVAGDGTTVLMAAVMGGHDALVGTLVDAVDDDEDALNARDNAGRTALWHAAARADFASLKILLLHPGVDPNAADSNGKTPLEAVATAVGVDSSKRKMMIEVLLCAGAVPFDGFDAAVEAAGLSGAALTAMASSARGDASATVLGDHATVTRTRASAVQTVETVDLAASKTNAAALRARLSSEPALSFIEPGEVEIGRVIGAGGFGTVYTATVQGATVVVKTVKNLVVREFMAEVTALVEITHPNTLEYVGVTLVGDGAEAAIVTEYMDGGDLMDRIEAAGGDQVSFGLSDRLSILAQSASALAYVHTMGLVHRDIKPHNIFLSATTPVVAKLGDFGLTAAADDDDDGCGGFTPRYAPPEVLHGGETANAAGDVFSFGLVVYETLALVRCADATERSVGGLPVRNITAAAPPVAGWDAAPTWVLITLLRNCFEPTTTNRPSAADLADALEVLFELQTNGDIATLFGATAARGHVSVLDRIPPLHFDLTGCVDGMHTALSLASRRGHVSMVRVLLARGADANLVDFEGYPPLVRAAKRGNLGCVAVLLDAGAAVNAGTVGGRFPGETALMPAAFFRFTDVVAALLAAGADPEIVADDGRRAIHYGAQEGAKGALAALLEAGADVNAPMGCGEDGRTALMQAVGSHRSLGCVGLLLAAGAEVNAATNNGLTSLMWAALGECGVAVEALLVAGADVDTAIGDGRTSLMLAAQCGNAGAVEALLAGGANISLRDCDGNTALTTAARSGKVGVINLLLAAGAEVNVAIYDGHTSLMLAAERGHTGAVEALLAAGADPTLVNIYGRTAESMAEACGHVLVVVLLRSAAD